MTMLKGFASPTRFVFLLVAAWVAIVLPPAMANPAAARANEAVATGVPFILPWDDDAASVVHLGAWNHSPAGREGHVRIDRDGRLIFERGRGERIRFFGVNLSAGGCFPEKADAPKIAARMAKFGINAVRFHHLEAPWSRVNIFAGRGADSTLEFDAEALDRLMHFIAALKREGIYINMNLLVSRQFRAADGLPEAIEQVGWKLGHVAAFYHPRMIELQKDYARKLLTHRNPHTGKTLAEDPAVAFIEIHNENGLPHAWMGGDMDRLPEALLEPLAERWNTWLLERYGDRESLARAWDAREQAPGEPLAINGDFARGTTGWFLERHAGADARMKRHAPGNNRHGQEGEPADPPHVEVDIQATGSAPWHVQLTRSGIAVKQDQIYTLCFEARADRSRQITVELSQAHEPWQNIGLHAEVELDPQWQSFRYSFVVRQDNRNARINFTGLGLSPGTFYLRQVELRPGGAVGLKPQWNPAEGTVPLLRRDGRTPWTAAAEADFTRFLWQVERDYWQTMQRFLRDELKVQALVLGTVLGCSTPHAQAGMDAYNAHGYWQHPRFPGRPWDPQRWHVTNQSMVNTQGGVLRDLALRRVADKPFLVTEYNHAAPNTYSSEAPLLAAAYGAYQDWDAIFLFDYNSGAPWDAQRITGFFAIDQHPTKMANLPAAAAMFRRGDVAPAGRRATVQLTPEQEVELIGRHGRAWNLLDATALGLPPHLPLVMGTGIELTDRPPRNTANRYPDAPRPPVFTSDTGELTWDVSRQGQGVVTVTAPRTRAVIGFGDNRRFELGDVTITPGQTHQNWCTIALTVVEGSFAGPGRALLVLTGEAGNTDMRWADAQRSTVGRDWGRSPSVVEVIPARIELPLPPARVMAWALDERGQRKRPIPVEPAGGGRTAIQTGGNVETIWYEIQWQ